MNKKIILIIVASVLAVALVTTGTIFVIKYINNNVGNTVLSFESKTALAGDIVKMPITLNKNHGFYYGQITVSYNADAIEFVSCASGEIFDECEVNDVDGTVVMLVNQSDLSNTKINGTLATLNFKIKETAAKGEYKIEFVHDEQTAFCNLSEPENLIIPELISGIITVK